MELHIIDISIIVGVLLLFLFIGLRQRSKTTTTESFFLGGRNLPWWLAGTSMVATTFAADTPLLVNEIVVKYGVSGNWFWWNMLAGGMLTTFFFAAYWHRAQILTDVEFIKIRYSGKAAQWLRSFKSIYLGVFMNALIIGWVNFALMSLIEVFFGVTDKTNQLMIVFAAMTLVYFYSGLSGYLAVVYTDFIQFIIAMIGSVLLAVIVINSEDIGGIENLKSRIPDEALDFFPSFTDNVGKSLSLGIGSFLTFIAMPWWASWYPGAEPGGGGYIAQRMMSTKNEKHAVYSSLYFQIAHYCIRPWPWILVALCSVLLYGDKLIGQERMGYVWVMKDYLPVGVKGLLLVAFFSAYMSTISTQLNWGSSYIVNDFYKVLIDEKADDKKLLSISRIAVAVMILVSVIATSFITSIQEVWGFLMSCGAGLGLVLILRWYWWRVNAWSEIAATIAPFIAYTFCQFVLVPVLGEEWGMSVTDDPRSFIFIVGFTTISWILVTFLTPKVDLDKLKSFYDRIQPKGNWRVFNSSLGAQRTELFKMFVLWLSTIVFAYSVLFLIGSILLKGLVDTLVFAGITIISLFFIKMMMKSTKLFS